MQYARPTRPAGRVPAWPPGRSPSGGEPVMPVAVRVGWVPGIRIAFWRRRCMPAAARRERGGGPRGGGPRGGGPPGDGGRGAGAVRQAGQETGRLVTGAGLAAGSRAGTAVDAVVERLDAER